MNLICIMIVEWYDIFCFCTMNRTYDNILVAANALQNTQRKNNCDDEDSCGDELAEGSGIVVPENNHGGNH